MSLDRIYICCHKGDFRFAQICIASVRRHHEQIPITLLVDTYRGIFSTKTLRKQTNLTVELSSQPIGSPFLKLLPLLKNERERFLILDADTCLVKPLPSSIIDSESDFVVHPSTEPKAESLLQVYFDFDRLTKLDPSYKYPGYFVNTGQFIATSGILTHDDFDPYIDWNCRPVSAKDPTLFRLVDECILNYLWTKLEFSNRFKIQLADLWHWSESIPSLNEASLPIVHWAGITAPSLAQMKHGDYLAQLEREFYASLPFGRLHRNISAIKFSARRYLRKIKSGLLEIAKNTRKHVQQ